MPAFRPFFRFARSSTTRFATAFLLLLVVLFGGLGIFVAKVFFVALLVALLLSLVSGGMYFRGGR